MIDGSGDRSCHDKRASGIVPLATSNVVYRSENETALINKSRVRSNGDFSSFADLQPIGPILAIGRR